MTTTQLHADVNRTISENIAVTLHRAGMSRRALSVRLGVSHTLIYGRMDGTTEWTVSECLAVGEILGLSLQELTGPLPEFEEWAARVRQQGLEPRTR